MCVLCGCICVCGVCKFVGCMPMKGMWMKGMVREDRRKCQIDVDNIVYRLATALAVSGSDL